MDRNTPVDSRSSSSQVFGRAGSAPVGAGSGTALGRRLRLFVAVGFIAVALLAAGCGRHAVRATEKEYLADRTMIFDEDGQETSADEHVLTNREGSAGGRGSGGGGCGCN